MKIISISSIKGGVGKTTIAYHIAFSGKKTLCLDFDPQRNLSFMFGHETPIDSNQKSSFDLMVNGGHTEKIKINNKIDLIPSNFRDFDFEYTVGQVNARKETISNFKPILAKLFPEYELIIIDCGPSQTTPSLAAQFAADLIISPILPNMLSKMSVHDLIDFHQKYGIKNNILFIPNQFRSNINMHKIFIDGMINVYSDNVLTPIPVSNDLSLTAYHKKPLLNNSKGGKAMQNMIKEVLQWLK